VYKMPAFQARSGVRRRSAAAQDKEVFHINVISD
jgi:hypothetical protein